ncbi:TonB-dependent receptor [Hirschia litorea]|uniref:TonB-dependent receptor n=1 Tax=Hirschia litorea TaxID=1199156 RepID=A0ABW2IQ59_9PROT
MATTICSLPFAQAQTLDDRYDFHIETGTLGSVLDEFVDTANIQLLYPHELSNVTGLNPVIGQYTIEEALQVLLEGTHFSGGLTKSGVIVIALNNSGRPQEREAVMSIGELQKTKKKALLAGAAAMALSMSNQQAVAQANDDVVAVGTTAQDENLTQDVIVVTGIRKSLQDAAAIKRNADGVVDAISAEDIGKFPDTNLAESLQRITGVSIDRSNGEGNQVSVRGFGPRFNLVTLNGRQMPKASTQADVNVNRGFNFRELSSEVVSGVEVLKTGRANVASGGIGSTINIKTSRPLDIGKQQISLGVKGVVDTTNEAGDDVTPEIVGLYSNVFMDGRLGILVSAAHAERNSRSEQVKIDGWIRDDGTTYTGVDRSGIDRSTNPTGTFFVPRNYVLNVGDHDRQRQNYQGVVQFKPTDRLTATLDYTGSRFQDDFTELETSFWFDSDSGTMGVADANGTVTSPRHNNHRMNFGGLAKTTEIVGDSFGANLEWEATDDLTLVFDYHNSVSKSQPDGNLGEVLTVLSGNTFDVDIGVDMTGNDIPNTVVVDSRVPGGTAFAASAIQADVSVGRGRQIENTVEQAQIGGVWENALDNGFKRLNFGASYTNYQYDDFNRFWFAVVDTVDISNFPVSFVPRGDVAANFSGQETLFQNRAIYDVNALNRLVDDGIDFENVETGFPPFFSSVTEETLSAYLSGDFEAEFHGLPIDVNAGVRIEKTETTGSSTSNLPRGLRHLTNESLEQIAADSADIETNTADYTEFLPNIDAKLNFTDNLIGRLSYSRTITRSNLEDLAPGTVITNTRPSSGTGISDGIFTARQGDTGLLPYSSNNIDASLEWYYGDEGKFGAGEGSYFSIGYFSKDVQNFIGTQVFERTINSSLGVPITDPSANPRPGCPDSTGNTPACESQPGDPVATFDVVATSNLGSAKVDGFEVNLQHLIGDTGFGFIANATFVDSDAEYDINSLEQRVALPGLSDSANLVAFYDKHGFQARAAYNWRDEFLLQTNQFHSPDEPVFTEAYGQLDVSASYEINGNFTVFLEGLNVTEEGIQQHGRFNNQFLRAEAYGARYNFGVRASF